MLKKILSCLLVFTSLLSCNSNAEKDPVDDIGVARTFIRNILDNNFNEAERFLLKNETNQQYFERFRQTYNAQGKDKLEKYKAADITIYEVTNVSDSVTIVNYSNSYIKDSKSKVKLVRINGKWLVDLQYTFSGNL
ncbi:MAG TPA: hypothetical protein VK489_11530 [Ferruginibacter sp.]|nr:hypothetical protein [Ferruginibacter sp.]